MFIGLSVFFLGLGAIGALIPGLPMTPFIILSSFFATKGSKRLSDKIVSSKLYVDYVADLKSGKGMGRRQKFNILIVAGLMIGIIIILSQNIWMKMFLSSIYILKLVVFIVVIPSQEVCKND